MLAFGEKILSMRGSFSGGFKNLENERISNRNFQTFVMKYEL